MALRRSKHGTDAASDGRKRITRNRNGHEGAHEVAGLSAVSGDTRRGNTYVYYPGTLSELLQTYRREADALIYAGGTFLLSQRNDRFVSLPPTVISLQEVEELQRVSRTERFVELGAGVPLQSILRLGPNNVPAALCDAVRHIGPPAVGGLATLGGNVAIPGRLMTATPVLALMDARTEVRRQGGVRWIPVVRLHRPDGSLELNRGEIITRIRIPLYPWSVQIFRRFGSELSPESNPLSFCGLARMSNGILEELRIAGSAGQLTMMRHKGVEADLVGRRLPLGERDIRSVVEAYSDIGFRLNSIQKDRFRRLVQWFLLNLPTLR